MDCLLELLRGKALDREWSEAEWQQVLALAEEEHVLPWAVSCLRALPFTLPAALAERVTEVERTEGRTAFFWCAELQGVLHAFAARGVSVVLLKGPSLAERLYGSASLRPCRDLDLLVAKADWRRAEEILTAIGFAPMREADDYHRPWLRQTTKLELHSDVENPLAFDFHVAGALARAGDGNFFGEPCRLLAPEDELLYLCLHAARHRYDRLSLVLDLRLAFERLATEGWRSRTEVAGLNGLLVLGLVMAQRLKPGLRDGWNPGVSREEWRHLQEIADGLWRRLMTEPFRPRGWSAAHRFYLDLEPNGSRRLRRRLRHARILAARAIDRDSQFAARFALTREWQVRLLRPVRLLIDRMTS